MLVPVLASLLSGFVDLAVSPRTFELQSSPVFADLFDQYRHGDADQAVTTFATWSPGRIEEEARPAESDRDLSALAALALFHSEAWLRQGPGGMAHHHIAVDLMTHRVCTSASLGDRSRWLNVCRAWYPVMLRQGEFLAETGGFMPDDAVVQLARGAWAEYWMGPALDSGGGADTGFLSESLDGPFITTSHGRFGRAAGDAQAFLRRALALDPDLAEARLRLGRVLCLLDQHEEARRELERAARDARTARSVFSEYLAAMFLGQLHEDAGRVDDALGAYRRAAEIDRRFPGAPVALARLLAATGRMSEGSGALADFFRLQPAGWSAIDPWTEYPRGRAYWHRGQILRALRVAVRE